MFGAVRMKVVELERIKMGNLTLPQDLRLGDYIELSLEKIKNIK